MVLPALMSTEEGYLGRQPILDRNQSLYAFELLFRAGKENKANVVENVGATSVVIAHTLSEFGINAVLGKHPGFVNCDSFFLCSDVIELLPPERMVLEILETVVADDVLLERCAELKQKGFKLALDDFQDIHAGNRGFLDLVDIIKVNVNGLSREKLKDIMAQIAHLDVLFLAEKVEREEEFRYCLDLGFDLFQGFFFAKAEGISGKRFTTAQTAIFQLLAMIQSDTDVTKVVEAFKQNPALSVGLLRLINSVSVGLGRVVSSIQNAVVYLGYKQLQRWLLLLLMAHGNMKSGRHLALIHQAVSRARFMELMALSDKDWKPYADSAFITGIVSVMKVLLNMDMETLVESLGLMPEVRDALLKKKGILGDLLNLAEALERDEALKVDRLVHAKVKGGYELVFQVQGQTISWVNQIVDAGIVGAEE